MTTPELAVLMPVYNPSDDIGPCIDSLKAQTIPFRLFLVDDGSKRKVDYRALTKGMDCRIIELPQNLGITGALNTGLAEILKGDFKYVARVDYPDISHPTRFAKQIDFLRQHPDHCMVGTGVRYLYTLTGVSVAANHPTDFEGCARLLRYNAPLTHGAIMFQADFLQTLGSYSHDYPAAEDYAMEFLAFRQGRKFANLPDHLYTTIEIQQSISVASRAKQLKSRLKLQRENADWLSIHTWLGIARTLTLMYAPLNLLRRLRSIMQSSRGA
jgi:glycosyltransferase involved in cell wall biosynthesis